MLTGIERLDEGRSEPGCPIFSYGEVSSSTAEVDGACRRFDSQMGFYSQVEPKLVTYMRGADEGIDTQWMSSAAAVSHWMGWANRVGSFFGKAFVHGGPRGDVRLDQSGATSENGGYWGAERLQR